MERIEVTLEQIRTLDQDRTHLPDPGVAQISPVRECDRPHLLPGQAQTDGAHAALPGHGIDA
ncbi:hypothetical protein D3C78_1429670 [compost metagenome]